MSTLSTPRTHRASIKPRRALLIAADPAVRRRAARIIAAAGLDLTEEAPTAVSGTSWSEAEAVIVDADALSAVLAIDPHKRSSVFVIAGRKIPDDAWRDCVALGVDDAVALDDAEEWLVERLALLGPVQPTGAVYGLVGACGGVGTSATATALAYACTDDDKSVLLIDADPKSSCLDLHLGKVLDGLGWSDLTGLPGRVTGAALQAALPTVSGIPVLSVRRDDPPIDIPPETLRAVIAASAASFDTTLVDFGTWGSLDLERVTAIADRLIIVTTTDARGAATARRLLDALGDDADRIVVAARTPHSACLSSTHFTELVPTSNPPVWLREIRRPAARFKARRPLVDPGDRLIDDAIILLEHLREPV